MKTSHPTTKWLLVLILTIYPLHLATGATIYVDAGATGANNGSSWANAYKYLQNALIAAEPNQGIQIWVAQGTYRPDKDTAHPTGTNDRTATFQLKNGVAIYGGYPHGGGSRNPNTYTTILSGDINVPDSNSDNSYHVITSSSTNSTAILDGFTITKGKANGSDTFQNSGGGMCNRNNSSPTLTNCTFTGNSAYYGGGMYNFSDSNPTLTNCTFSDNSANGYYSAGGGMENTGSDPILNYCTFTGNSADFDGGGMHSSGSNPTLTNCIFAGNSAKKSNGGGIYSNYDSYSNIVNCTFTGNDANYGGGMYNSYSNQILNNCTFSENSARKTGGGMANSDSNPILTDCTFTGNDANYGGGMENSGDSSPTLTNCTFTNNDANYDGGGMYNLGGGVFNMLSPIVTNCTFIGNSAGSGYGGGMYNMFSRPAMTNCTFTGNSADGGGGMNNMYYSDPTLTNCTFTGNSAGNGGGMQNYYFSRPTLANCTFTGNLAQDKGGGIYNISYSGTTVINCTFTGNSAESDGGGIENYSISSLSVTNSTFTGNSAILIGGGIHNSANCGLTLKNCILWGNTAPTGPQVEGYLSASYCDIQGGYSGTGNINADPLFVDADGPDNIFGTADDNPRLLFGSPCIDDGNNTAVPEGIETDLDGNPRFLDVPGTPDKGNGTPPIVDMGAYECEYQPVIIYVDANATGANNGTTWADAYKYLQDAIAVASGDSTIWVAQGTYRPDKDTAHPAGTNDRTATFQLKNFMPIYGGFPSGGGVWDNRSPSICPTILSGDIGVAGNNSDNSYHVVTGSNTDSNAILDGFTITKGNANGSSPYNCGGGMYNSTGSPTVTSCTFTSNSASNNGGGMYNYDCDPRVTSCTFTGNAADLQGGGIFNQQNSWPILDNCKFIGNSASSQGGGACNDNSSPTLTYCTFSNNSATNNGGGMSNLDSSSPTMNYCTFTANSATIGGGIYDYNNSLPTLNYCTFSDNSANGAGAAGGGMYNYNSSQTMTYCKFIGNSGYYGGAMYNHESFPTLTNCIFTGNSADDSGGGILNYYSNPKLTNCSFSSNSASNRGGGVYNTDNSDPNLTNCILWGNTAATGPQIYNYGTSSSPTVTFSDVQGGYSGTGNINANPLFIDADGPDNVFGTADDNLRLFFGSPCIDAADNNAVPSGITYDLDGRPRFKDDPATGDTGHGTPPIVDMGAYEYQPVIYVDANATGANNGLSWANAYNYLQDALSATLYSTNPIWVAQGTYRPDEDTAHPGGTNNRGASFQLGNNVIIYGGFPSGGGTWESRDPNMYETILSGDLNEDDEPNFANNSENSYRVATIGTAILDGFTITAGNADGPHNYGTGSGGGMFYNGSPTVANCIFSGNSANCYGGGMFGYIGNPTITNCIFIGNSAKLSYGYGGGLCNYSTSPTVTNCTFIDNSANCGGGMFGYGRPTNCVFIDNSANAGGGIYGFNLTVTNCTFSGNSAVGSGGGLVSINGSSPLTNCIFIANSAQYYGGGLLNANSNTPLTNCTFIANSAQYQGGGIYDSNSNPALTNCILWGNTAPTGPQIFNNATSSATVSFSDVQGGWTGTGNINLDPRFVNASAGNLRLLANSPCIDKGNNAGVSPDIADLDGDYNIIEPTPLDLDLRLRFADGDCNSTVIVDMGAFEFSVCPISDFDGDCFVDFSDFAVLADSWLQNDPLVDIAPPPAGDGIVDIEDLAVLCDDWLVDYCLDMDDDGYIDQSCGGNDCDDNNPSINPGATEVCDGIDNDCDSIIDNVDMDHDGYIDQNCGGNDCNDNNPNIHPGAVELCANGKDDDCDGFSDCADSHCTCVDADGDGYGINVSPCCSHSGLDCNDNNPNINPGAAEVCDGLDNDCDSIIDNVDMDNDGYIDQNCGGNDCNDNDPNINPGVTEICDGLDNDCDSIIDNRDMDDDGYIDQSCGGNDCSDNDPNIHPGATEVCDYIDNDCDSIIDNVDMDGDGYIAQSCGGNDCNDNDPNIHPGAAEICDGIDNDCNWITDNVDMDHDGYIDQNCGGNDCNDNDPNIHPGATEFCNGKDDDCDSIGDCEYGQCPCTDADGDGYGSNLSPCCPYSGFDCNDNDPNIHPGAAEICDGNDNDCDSIIDNRDMDNDGYIDQSCGGNDCNDNDPNIHPGAGEICDNGMDDNCDGLIDANDTNNCCFCENRNFDLNGDTLVNYYDHNWFFYNCLYGGCSPRVDYNCDGDVNEADLNILDDILNCFGPPYYEGTVPQAIECCEQIVP